MVQPVGLGVQHGTSLWFNQWGLGFSMELLYGSTSGAWGSVWNLCALTSGAWGSAWNFSMVQPVGLGVQHGTFRASTSGAWGSV